MSAVLLNHNLSALRCTIVILRLHEMCNDYLEISEMLSLPEM